MGSDVVTTFLRWTFLRAMGHRGYVLVSGLYFVVIVRLGAVQIVLLGAVMAAALVVSDIPAGVWSDAFSRKWSLVVGHGCLGAGMIMTGVVSTFPLVVVTQVLWGLGWAFSGGADVAWLSDELNEPGRVARVLTARARWDLAGGAVGIVVFGVLGWVAGLGTACVVSGAAVTLLGLFVAARFPEDNFRQGGTGRWRRVLRLGLSGARRDREIRLVLAVTMIVNGAGVVSWLFPKRLVDLGLPANPVVWYAAVEILSFALGTFALRIVEARIDGIGAARRSYALACGTGVLGLGVLAAAPNAIAGGAGVLLVRGIAFEVTRVVSVVWVNRRTASEVRATMHSFLSQAETLGEVLGGLALGVLVRAAGISATLAIVGAFIAGAGVLVARSGADLGELGPE
jgi:MFS transporter, DHA3 family, tetracycline resistance protein